MGVTVLHGRLVRLRLATRGRHPRVGFKPVGVMRRYEQGTDGTWHDGLLMDLVVDEFVDD